MMMFRSRASEMSMVMIRHHHPLLPPSRSAVGTMRNVVVLSNTTTRSSSSSSCVVLAAAAAPHFYHCMTSTSSSCCCCCAATTTSSSTSTRAFTSNRVSVSTHKSHYDSSNHSLATRMALTLAVAGGFISFSMTSWEEKLNSYSCNTNSVKRTDDNNNNFLNNITHCEKIHPLSSSISSSSSSSSFVSTKPDFRVISSSEIPEEDSDLAKSKRACAHAFASELFSTYEDGADDWVQVQEEEEEEEEKQEQEDYYYNNVIIDDDSTKSNIIHNNASTNHDHEPNANDDVVTNHNNNNISMTSNNNAVADHFVSFSSSGTSATSVPFHLKPRMSIRHTNRTMPRQDQGSDRHHLLLATSDDGAEGAANNNTTITSTSKMKTSNENVVRRSTVKDDAIDRVNDVRGRGLGDHQVYTKRMYFYQSVQIKEHMRNKFRLFALPSSEKLGKEMALLLGTGLHCVNIGAFSDGETSVKIEDTVRGKQIYVVCTTTSTTAIMELLLTISALRRGSAKRICAVIPYYGYSRQDRRTGMKREPIGAADVAKLLEEMGVDSVICCDLHNPLLKGFFSPTVPVDHIMPGPVAAAYFYEELFEAGGDAGEKERNKQQEMPKITVVAAHENQVFRANGFRNALQKLSGSDDIRVALISNTKALNVHDNTDSTLVGDVKGRKCIIIDDIINTGGTMRNAIKMVDSAGASEIYSWATHGVLHLENNDAPQKIQAMDCLKYLLISNSVAIERELPPKIRKLSIAPLLAEAVARSYHSESISTMLDVKAHRSEK